MNENIATIDVETTLIKHGQIPKTKFWGYADETGYKRFETTKQLSRYLRGMSQPKTILHHSNFDVIQMLADGLEGLQILKSHNGKLITCRYASHTLLNSFAVFPLALGKIFEAFGYKKSSLKNLAKRNYEDCVLGLECFLKLDDLFFALCGVSPIYAHTIAGTGFRAAEKVAGKMPKDLRFIEAYRGGRVEVFNTNIIRANAYDINSSYPYSFLDAPKKDTLLHIGVKTRDWYCPFFDEFSSDLLLFPNGKFTSWVYASNYERYIEPFAEKTNIKILSSRYNGRTKIDLTWLTELKPYIEKIYARKLEAKNKKEWAIELTCKLLLNSMYGRIGLRGSSERARFLDYKPDGDNIAAYRVGKRWLAFDEILREPRSNYPFATFITDNARARLFAGIAQHETYYCDTDSLFVRDGRECFRLNESNNLGEWGYNGCKRFRATNVKDYIWGRKEVLKGGNGHTVWTLKRLAQGKGAMEINKERKTGLRKRLVNADGTTEPLIVP